MKRGQIKLSFGVIFSLFLIGVFVFVAFYVMMIIMDLGETVKTSMFIDDLQDKIDEYYNSAGGGKSEVSFELKKEKINFICFFNSSLELIGPYDEQYEEITKSHYKKDNFYFHPRRYADPNSATIKHVKMNAFDENPYCVEKENGKFKFIVEKKQNEAKVKISRG